MAQYKIGIGILVFNPYDDEGHLERIENCIHSVYNSCTHFRGKSKDKVKLHLKIGINNVKGIGKHTQTFLENFVYCNELYNSITYYENSNSMGYAYSKLQQELYDDGCDYICVMADDYIAPKYWVYRMMDLFDFQPTLDFIMPITSYVTQKRLKTEIKKLLPKCVKFNKKGIESGLEIKDVDKIADYINSTADTILEPIHPNEWNYTNSVETTFFKRRVFDKVGFVNSGYNRILFQWDWYLRVGQAGFKGAVANSNFIFHYGKGGTKAIHKDTCDEKYEGSSDENMLLEDIALWNKSYNQNLQKWW